MSERLRTIRVATNPAKARKRKAPRKSKAKMSGYRVAAFVARRGKIDYRFWDGKRLVKPASSVPKYASLATAKAAMRSVPRDRRVPMLLAVVPA